MRSISLLTRRELQGFTLLEMLVVMAIMLIIVGGVFAQLNKLQQIYKSEETKVDATAEARNLIDELTRELHQSGYPGDQMFVPNVLVSPAINDQKVAAGLVRVTPSELWFEGDIDNDGTVDVVHYMLFDSAGAVAGGGSSCPCTLQRSQVPKANNTAPLAQASTYTSSLRNVINSGGIAGAGVGLPLAGSTNGTANTVLYNAYRSPNIFSALDQNGGAVAMPIDLTNPATLASVKSIVVTINTLSLSENISTDKARIPFTVTMVAKVNN